MEHNKALNGRRHGTANVNELTPLSKMRVEPSKSRSSDAKSDWKTVKKYGVNIRVGRSTKIQ